MKRIAIYSFILAMLLVLFGVPSSIKVLASDEFFTVTNNDVSDEETTLTVVLNVQPSYGSKMIISLPKSAKMHASKREDQELEIVSISNNVLFKKGDSFQVIVRHDKLAPGTWECDLPIYYKQQAYIQSKTVYASTSVASWDYGNVLTSPPAGDYLTKTQYGYKEITGYNYDDYSLEKPSGPYKEVTQYSYQTRSKETTYERVKYSTDRFYNNIGPCPSDCHDGTVNFYGTGCECVVTDWHYENKPTTTYGQWQDSGEWRYDEPYIESDVCKPFSRIVYLKPSSYSEEKGWRDEPYSGDMTTVAVSRTVYIPAASYTTSSWSDSYPSEGNVSSKTVCRFENNGVWSDWGDCN